MAKSMDLRDPNRQLRHFAITMSVHPCRAGTPFPDPADGDAATDLLDQYVQEALLALDGAVGPSNLRYRIAQLEIGLDPDREAGRTGVHIQAYVECFSSVRLRTMWRSLPYARVEPRLFRRTTARDYCTPTKGKLSFDSDGRELPDPTHLAGPWIVGTWRDDGMDDGITDSPLDAATDLIVEGQSPRTVARTFPRIWVRYGRGLRDLHESLWGSEEAFR